MVVGALQVELGESAKLTIHFDGGLIKRACLTAHGSDADVASLRDADEHPAAYRQRADGPAEPGSATSGDEPIAVGVVPVPDIALLAKRHVPVLAVPWLLAAGRPPSTTGRRACLVDQPGAGEVLDDALGCRIDVTGNDRQPMAFVEGLWRADAELRAKACSNASPAPARAAPRRRRPP